MEKGKKLTKEELENVGGGRLSLPMAEARGFVRSMEFKFPPEVRLPLFLQAYPGRR
jgi:hypothetical protein